jgi:hypothetical protein
MERNRGATAIRCLEIALHPNTSDDEVLAAVNGFRRTVGSTPLSEVCAGLTPDKSPVAHTHVADLAEWTERFARLSRENLELRRRLDLAKTQRLDGVRQVDETEQRLHDVSEELLAARRRATLAEQRLDDARDAYAQVTDGLKHEIAGLRSALERARNAEIGRRNAAEPHFSDFLNAAQQGADHPRFIQPTATPDPGSRSPWTA